AVSSDAPEPESSGNPAIHTSVKALVATRASRIALRTSRSRTCHLPGLARVLPRPGNQLWADVCIDPGRTLIVTLAVAVVQPARSSGVNSTESTCPNPWRSRVPAPGV